MQKTRTTTDRDAVAAPTFKYNHPKNYFGYAIAEGADGLTGHLAQAHVVRGAGAAKQGAQELELLDSTGDLTETGERVVTHARKTYGDLTTALEKFEEWQGTTNRFVTMGDGEWGDIAPGVIANHPAANLVLRVLADAPEDSLRLPDLVHDALARNEEIAKAVFIRDSVDLPDGRSERADELFEPDVYHTATTCQLKTVLYHAGLITETGSDSRSLLPSTSHWELDEYAPEVAGGGRE